MRIVYTSTSSTLSDDAGRVAYDYFDITIVENCYALEIVLDAGFADIDYRVHSASTAQTETLTITLNNDNSCTVTTVVKIKLEGAPDTDYQDITLTAPVDDYTGFITPSGNGIAVDNTDVARWATPTTYDVWI